MELTFFGATRTVTGSKYLLEHHGKRFLIDCGLYQGYKQLRLRNWQDFPVPPSSIDAVLLTHAHIDHSGYLPVLVREGFKGKIYATEATRDLCGILLPDSGRIQEEDARRANKYGYSKHEPALPLYTEEDAKAVMPHFENVNYGETIRISDDLKMVYNRSGHILGSAFITVSSFSTDLTFSGDLGRPDDPVMRTPATLQQTDYLVLESTYGDRLHDKEDPLDVLEAVINRTVKRGGHVIIPSFAVGRAQMLLYFLYQLIEQKRIRRIPIYLDSPMAIDATELLCRHNSEHRLSAELAEKVCHIAKYVHTPEQSKALFNYPMPAIIVSASGMATGGRILHHIKHYGPDRRNTLLFVGFQAAQTRGDRLLRGETEIKIHGEMIPIRAEVALLENTSAHADYEEMLTWLEGFRSPPRKVFLTHGESEAAEVLKKRIEEKFGWNVVIPDYKQTETL